MTKSTRKRLHLRSGNHPDAEHPGASHLPGEGAECSVRRVAAGPSNGARGDELPPGGPARGKQPGWGKAKEMAAKSISSIPAPRPFRHAVFASEAEYDRSVASVVARIHSGQVKARTPEE